MDRSGGATVTSSKPCASPPVRQHRPLRIAQVAPLTEAVPPRLYGGTERVVSFLTEELVRMGHDVTLFASGDSATAGRLEAVWPRALRLDPGLRDTIAPHMLLLERVRCMAAQFDVLHFHMDYWSASLFARQPVPAVTTVHGRLDLPELRPVYAGLPRMNLVSISLAQRAALPQAGFVATIPHGLPVNLLTPRPVAPRHLAFLGRISPEKRPDRAIRIARAAGMPLRLAGKVDRADAAYFEAEIRPMLGPDACLIGEIDDAAKSGFLSAAHALLFPIDWPEPFGLVMIESMGCGTPVIAMRRGSVPEVMDDGLTGFVVENVEEAIEATKKLHTLDRKKIRAQFDKRWTSERMASDYVKVYQKLIDQRNGLAVAA